MQSLKNWWNSLSNGDRLFVVGAIVLAVGVLFWIPFTRTVIVTILPLGSGIDDLICVGGVLLGLLLIVFRVVAGKRMG